MSLQSGTRLGSYEIVEAIGSGGMGDVYRARDTKLGREVAIKTLSAGFAFDEERVARFGREAQILASLNHPNIAAIYGFEEAKESQYLILELVEGGTLAERLKSGPLPIDEALDIARQIADALQAAHEKGIIHRDLKPGNIAFTREGQVKVLDFGLAKALQTGAPRDMSNSPTLTIGATQAGVILGTAAYMAPEQARGRDTDKRADVWAFGCVLYEMLTGKRVFEGEDVSDTLANTLKIDPDWSSLPANTPEPIRLLLKRCLEKDRRQRIADVSTAYFVVKEHASLSSSGTVATATPAPARPVWKWIALIAALALVVASVGPAAVWYATRPTAPRLSRFMITPSGAAAVTAINVDREIALTPDGSHIVYVGNNATQLFVRALDQLDPAPLPLNGVRGPRGPFVSPDGKWVGFFDAGGLLKKAALAGGPALTVCKVTDQRQGATWSEDDTIIFATGDQTTGLIRVAAAGGEPVVLTKPDHTRGEADHLWPEFLPGGKAVLFTITSATGGVDAAQIAVLDLRTGAQKVLLRGGSHAHYVSTGHLVYSADEVLLAVPFDLQRLEVRGTPVPVLSQVVTKAKGAAEFDVARDGTLVYVLSTGVGAIRGPRTLMWVDRQGHEEPINAPVRSYLHPRLSPDGSRLAVDISDQEQDIWVWDFAHETLTRVTSDPAGSASPVWTADGRRLIFVSGKADSRSLYLKAADNTGTLERLMTSAAQLIPYSVSTDGKFAVFLLATRGGDRSIMQLSLDPDHHVQPLLQKQYSNAELSPDGRWVAYESTESREAEIYVRPFPDVDRGQWQVSTSGGSRPVWSRNSQELFYTAADGTLMGVRVEKGTTWAAGNPAKVFDQKYFTLRPGADNGRTYDISPDGKRFLMIKQAGGASDQPAQSIVIVQHWTEELKRLVPVK